LFFGSEPFPSNNYDLVAAESGKDGNAVLASLKEDTEKPESLRNHIRDCVNPVANKRPDFEFILKRQKPFEKIIAEFLENTRGEAAQIWGDSPVPTLKFKEFENGWFKVLGITLQDKQKLMLRAIMNIDIEPENVDVKRTDFELFLSWFGPVTRKTLPDIWRWMELLMKDCKWFFGRISGHDAKAYLRKNDAADNYLVRLNTGEGEDKSEPFILVYRKASDKKTYEYSFKPNFASTPEAENKKYLDSKKISNFKPCDPSARNPKFDRPFKAGAAHGGGYKTDANLWQAINISM
jgi:hypothetical protein